MKTKLSLVPFSLLILFLVFVAFQKEINLAHSLILFSLATLAGFQQLLLHREQPSMEKELDKLRVELKQLLAAQKEYSEAKITKMEDELLKVSIGAVKSSSTSAFLQKEQSKKVVF